MEPATSTGASLDNPCERVRTSCAAICKTAKHVSIRDDKIAEFSASLLGDPAPYVSWTEDHFDPSAYSVETIVAYVCVVDSINFCFWPTPDFEYRELTAPLNSKIAEDPAFFSATRLAEIDSTVVSNDLYPQFKLVLVEERAALIR